jgi:transcriptional regulator with GAF, ATPase, and Fis domain
MRCEREKHYCARPSTFRFAALPRAACCSASPCDSFTPRMLMEPSRLSNKKGSIDGTGPFLRLARSASIEEVLEDLTEIAAEKGICICSVRFTSARIEREYKIPNAIKVGRIGELAVGVGGGQTHLVVKFIEPLDIADVCALEYAAHLAAHRIEILAGGGGGADSAGTRNVDRSHLEYGLIGESGLIQQVRQDIEIAASLDLSVLIIGEPGTGKELVAQGIHRASRRARNPFEDVNCAAINPNLIESELFGHERGAFTGAQARKIGLFEIASGGTLFLDEIGDLPLESQAKLLRVLQERKLKRVGGTEAIKIDTRLVAATNKDLRREIDEGRFRRDLYDRLRGYPIRTPSLREHPTDIPILIRHYYPFVEFQEEALELLCHYSWPGNVRELRSTIERLAAKAGGGQIITANHVRRETDAEQMSVFAPGNAECFPRLREGESLIDYICRGVVAVYERERSHLRSHSATARRLGMNRTTLYDWLEWAREHVAK